MNSLAAAAARSLGVGTRRVVQKFPAPQVELIYRPHPASSAFVRGLMDNVVVGIEREFSSLSLRRPPQRLDELDPKTNKHKIRAHAVSLELGDYSGFEDEDDVDVSRTRAQQEWLEQELELSRQAQQIHEDDMEQKKRWLENAKPPERVPIIDDQGRAYGRGGRKMASARVWIQPGMGHVVVNRKDLVDYFERISDRELILAPLAATRTCGKFDVTAYVQGGGLTGQAGALRHGLARALNNYNPDTYRAPLKRLGYLTRDPRKVERKKIGHKKARKMPQWVKR